MEENEVGRFDPLSHVILINSAAGSRQSVDPLRLITPYIRFASIGGLQPTPTGHFPGRFFPKKMTILCVLTFANKFNLNKNNNLAWSGGSIFS